MPKAGSLVTRCSRTRSSRLTLLAARLASNKPVFKGLRSVSCAAATQSLLGQFSFPVLTLISTQRSLRKGVLVAVMGLHHPPFLLHVKNLIFMGSLLIDGLVFACIMFPTLKFPPFDLRFVLVAT